MEHEKILELDGLYWEVDGKTILNIDRFYITKGEVVALIGPNGAGKSSLIKQMALLEKPTKGKFLFEGQTISRNPLAVRRQMAMVFQEPLLLNTRVFDNVAQGLKLRGVPQKIIKDKVNFWLERLKIKHLAKQQARTLSGGEAQRVNLARAMVLEPKLLFLDEPFSALDLPSRESLLLEISDIIKTTKTTTIFITHDMSEIPIMADRVTVLINGKIRQEGTPIEIFNYPSSEEVARLVGIDNIFSGVIKENTGNRLKIGLSKELAINSYPAPNYFAGSEVKVFIRSDEISLLQNHRELKENTYTGIVTNIIPRNTQFKVLIDCGRPLNILVSKGVFFEQQLAPGKQVRVYIPPEKVHIIGKK